MMISRIRIIIIILLNLITINLYATVPPSPQRRKMMEDENNQLIKDLNATITKSPGFQYAKIPIKLYKKGETYSFILLVENFHLT